MGQIALDLVGIADVIACIQWAAALFEIATNMEAGLVADWTAIAEVEAVFAETKTGAELGIATLLLPGVRNVVDDRTWRLGSIGGSRATAYAFNTGDAGVKAGPVIVVAELNVAEQNGW